MLELRTYMIVIIHTPLAKDIINFGVCVCVCVCRPEESEEEKLAREEMEKVWEEEQKKFLKDDNTPGAYITCYVCQSAH